MADIEHLAILKQGVKVWNSWREKNPIVVPDLQGANLQDLNLIDVNLESADLRKANLQRADLHKAILFEAYLDDTILEGALLEKADLTNTELHRANLQNTVFIDANLQGANLERANITKANFQNANLRNVNLERADLTGSNFIGVDFKLANLQDAIAYANFQYANLEDTILQGTDFQYADLTSTNLSGAILYQTLFANADLSETNGLSECNHFGPSIINNSTLHDSGILPEVFLKGIGLFDWEIEHSKLHQKDLNQEEIAEILNNVHQLRAGSPLQVHNLFISYAHKNVKFVDKLAETLDKKGVRFWRDLKDLPNSPAGPLDKVILKEMKGCVVLLILSEKSVSSDWVRFEIESAAKIGIDEGREVLLPIALDNSWKDYNWPLKLKDRIFDYNIIDFSEWENENIYNQRFQQVLEGLDLFYKAN